MDIFHDVLYPGKVPAQACWLRGTSAKIKLRRLIFGNLNEMILPTESSMHHWIHLLTYDIQELHDAEMRLLEFWPRMAEQTANPWLKEAFDQQADATERQIARLEQMAQRLAVAPDTVCSKGMKGLITEAGSLLGAEGDPRVIDSALVGAARKFEHYGLAAYYTARLLAQRMDLETIAELLGQSLAEVIASHDILAAAAEGRDLSRAQQGVAGG